MLVTARLFLDDCLAQGSAQTLPLVWDTFDTSMKPYLSQVRISTINFNPDCECYHSGRMETIFDAKLAFAKAAGITRILSIAHGLLQVESLRRGPQLPAIRQHSQPWLQQQQ